MTLLRPRPLLATSAAALCLMLAACGTDIQWLLSRDSILVAKADDIAAAAEAVDPELATEMYDAEDAKRAACETIYQSISAQMTQRPSYGEELGSDVGLFVAYLVPIPEVERCARAQAAYQVAVERLQKRLQGRGAMNSGAAGSGN
ncbi:MAG TPA: hypothetical protein VE914_20435 [Candidatus Angelobacter sp.]|nr:hypothetical protein [Candidatus Angelobacter sp.]